MSKEILFHGGPIATEFFDGHSFWTWNLSQAIEYMDGDDDLWVIEMEKSSEVFADEEDYLPDGGYSVAEDDEHNWEIQTDAIRAAVSGGATVVICDDGWVVVNVERLNPRRVTVEEAEEIEWKAF